LEKLTQGLSPQAIICDIEMPRLDGFGFLAHIKAKDNLRSLPVMMLTSRSGGKYQEIAFSLGASAYFSKPFQEEELLQAIRRLITPALAPMA